MSIENEQIKYEKKGKPYIDKIQFNISHSADFIALVFGKNQCGIDGSPFQAFPASPQIEALQSLDNPQDKFDPGGFVTDLCPLHHWNPVLLPWGVGHPLGQGIRLLYSISGILILVFHKTVKNRFMRPLQSGQRHRR